MRYELFETDEFIKTIQPLQPQNARFIRDKLETYVTDIIKPFKIDRNQIELP